MAHEDVFLETDRLVIRNWRADDWLLILPMSLDPEVVQYIGHYQPWSEDETRQFVSNRISDFKRHGWTMWPTRVEGDEGVRRLLRIPAANVWGVRGRD